MDLSTQPPEELQLRRISPAVQRREGFMRFLAFIIVLLTGMFFRFTGLLWGDYEYQHPDERFLIWVVADIAPVDSLGDYFNTRESTLNPANRGHEFYVYGDLPVIAARYLTEASFESVGWNEILQTARGLSALSDLLTVLLVFLAADRLFGWRVGLLAGLFSAGSVLNIQQAHFFTTDTFATAFSMLAIYLAVLLTSGRGILRSSLLFGLAVGLAMASKLNTFPVAFLLPLALLLAALRQGVLRLPGRERLRAVFPYLIAAAASGLVAFLAFRVAQPYAFTGPTFFDVRPDPAWIQTIQEQRAQAAGDVDFPPALQWARRPIWFSFQNLVLWGLGAPLGILGFAGLVWFAYRLVRLSGLRRFRFLSAQPWAGSLIVWIWTAVYFSWQSMAWNPTMRYQLPVYPVLALLAGWLIYDLWWMPRTRMGALRFTRPRAWRVGVGVLAAIVLLSTLAYAFAFTRIYTRTETRVAASEWILENVPGPVNLEFDSSGETWRQMLPVGDRYSLRSRQPYLTYFNASQSGALEKVLLERGQATSPEGSILLRVRIFDPDRGGQDLAAGEFILNSGGFERVEVPVQGIGSAWPRLEQSRMYGLALEIPGEGTPGFVDLNGALQVSLYGRALEVKINGAGSTADLRLEEDGTLREIHIPPIEGTAQLGFAQAGVQMLDVMIQEPDTGMQHTALATAIIDPLTGLPSSKLRVDPPIPLRAGVTYQAAVTLINAGEALDPSQPVLLELLDEPFKLGLPAVTVLAREQTPLFVRFSPFERGLLRQVTLGHAIQMDPEADSAPILLRIADEADPSGELIEVRLDEPLENTSSPGSDPRGTAVMFTIDPPLQLETGKHYTLSIEPDGPGVLAVRGSAPANESTWDMGLPFRMGNYDPYGGIYRGDLNFEMYWDDNEDKYQRFINILDQADYIFISSNRQWGTTTRLPERHPLTTAYYRALLGCPADREVIWCYNVAEVGTFEEQLGFELAQVFTSYPNLGPIQFNTQFAEEAFTVYDHPKVFLFKKSTAYDPTQVRAILGAVDLENVVRVTPKNASNFKDMLLPAWHWATQQAGGTWANLFPPEGLQNRYPWIGAVLWYLALAALGWFVYPLTRLALPGLPDRGYPLARITGLLLLAYPLFLGGVLGVPVTRLAVGVVFAALVLVGLLLTVLQREDLRKTWREERGYFLCVELIALALFGLGIIIRLGNPDLWHPIFGGEKPMDLSYFNAVVKSTVFPPYDPWFAGGALNYYYYGFILVGLPLKLVGIAPQIGYNLILPALFSMVGLAAFSIVWNLAAAGTRAPEYGVSSVRQSANPTPALPREHEPEDQAANRVRNPGLPDNALPARSFSQSHSLSAPYRWGLAAVLALLLIGNLGTVRMFWQGWKKLVVSEEQMVEGSLVENVTWAGQGLVKWVESGFDPLPFYPGDWYWKPSRAIQPEAGNEITEFPFFTFLYADLHAHLIALPVTLLLIAWAVSAVIGCTALGEKGRLWRLSLALSIMLGALAAGALRPTNTWDQYTYLPFAMIALVYSQVRARRGNIRLRLARGVVMALALAGLALLLYRPFDIWFGQGYNALDLWNGSRTGINSYLVHWGLFLFVIAAWVFDETVDWLANTPLAALNRLRGYRGILLFGLIVVLLAMVGLVTSGVHIALIVVPLGLWVTALLFRPGQAEAKRAVLFMIGTALALTLAVELVAVRGDIGRMNTVFKFYYQAWSLLALSAAAALSWLWGRLKGWNRGWRAAWITGLGLLVAGAALYPFVATNAKWNDRMVVDVPRTLDGMAFMSVATYSDGNSDETYTAMDLSQDYRAIRWMQANVPGSPVIVEANTPEYRHWGTRFTIYTGLPGVVGWNWHQRQQRAITPDTWVTSRIDDVHTFYRTASREEVERFLRRYGVQYIILGQLERIWYGGPGLDKFAAWEGDLWEKVYEEGETAIYRVLE